MLAEYNRVRPDTGPCYRCGSFYLVTDDQDEGPTAAIFEAMGTEQAAAMLSSLATATAQGIIVGLSPKKANAVITAMHAMTGGPTLNPPLHNPIREPAEPPPNPTPQR